jgi:hypothetical protein
MCTSIGSLPHTDPDEAAALVLSLHPDLPAAPELPRRTPREGMLARAATAIPGVAIAPDGGLQVDVAAVEAALADGVPGGGDLDPEADGGLCRFLELLEGRDAPLKVQLVGPVTLGWALGRAGVRLPAAFAVAAGAVAVRGRAILEHAARRAPDAPVVVFLDEPSLGAVQHPGFPLAPYAVIDLLAAAIASLHGAAAVGVHCCGPADWQMVSEAGPDVLSLPLAFAGALDAPPLAAFLGAGGWVAWGAVPTDEPVGDDSGLLWRRLVGVWCDLARAGCATGLLRERALVTPACGLAGHGVTQAERALRLTTELCARVREAGSGRRLTIGA